MSFTKLFPQYSSSLNPLRGNAIQCSVKKLRQNMILVNTVPITKQMRFILEIKDVEVFGKPKMLLPKPQERKCRSKLVWTELTKIWRSDRNLIKGFILNSVKGGYAVAIAGHIAFLPKNICRN
jgi:ribosomal protein S1